MEPLQSGHCSVPVVSKTLTMKIGWHKSQCTVQYCGWSAVECHQGSRAIPVCVHGVNKTIMIKIGWHYIPSTCEWSAFGCHQGSGAIVVCPSFSTCG